METSHRLATVDDAQLLFDMRRRSILALAPRGMSIGDAELWAAALSGRGMQRKLRELEIWVVELAGVVAGWGAIRGDCLEGLYVAPEVAGRGVGANLLEKLEGLMRERGIRAVRAEASSNAKDFYLRRGYRMMGPQTPAGAWPIVKQLSPP